MKEDTKTINEIHLFRGLAIFLIVASHLLYADQSSIFFKVVSSIYLNSTLFFLFISGYLFRHLIHKFRYKSYLIRKLKYVILPYLIISIPALALRIVDGPSFMAEHSWPAIGSKSIFEQTVYHLLTGAHLVPLWYIPVVALLFLISPLLKVIDDYPILYCLTIPLGILSIILYRDPLNINDIFRMFGHCLSIYILGMFYHRYSFEIEKHLTNRVISIIFFLIIVCILFSINTNGALHYRIIFIQKILAIFLLIRLLPKLRIKGIQKVLSELANASFGIYFIHFYLILAIRMLSLRFTGEEYPYSPMNWILIYLTTLIISYFTVLIIKKIVGNKSRLIIGS